MSVFRPAYQISVGGQRIDSAGAPLASTVTAIDVRLDIDPMTADQAVIRCGQVGAFEPETGDDATIALGYADEGQDVEQVMRGTVVESRPGVTSERITCLSSAAGLARTRAAETTCSCRRSRCAR